MVDTTTIECGVVQDENGLLYLSLTSLDNDSFDIYLDAHSASKLAKYIIEYLCEIDSLFGPKPENED